MTVTTHMRRNFWLGLLASGLVGGIVAVALAAGNYALWLRINTVGPGTVGEALQEVGWLACLIGLVLGLVVYFGHSLVRGQPGQVRKSAGIAILLVGMLAWLVYAGLCFLVIAMWVTG